MLSSTKLVGRGVEISKLDEAYRRAAAGEFRAMVLIGDPGLGKTRLTREFLARKSDRSITLFARGHPFGTTASFGIWSEALDRHLRALPQQEVVALSGGSMDDLATLLHRVVLARGAASEGQPSRTRLLAALSVLVSNLTKRSPVIAVIDDAHDADPSSWEALSYLARDLADARLLVIAVARRFELGENRVATEMLRRLEQDDVLDRLELNALDSPSLGQLAGNVLQRSPSKALVDWLAARSRGNPLFALGLLQALLDEGADLAAPTLRSIPETLSERVAGDVRKLQQPAVAVLESLATLGRRLELREVVALSGLAVEGVARIMDGLVRSRFVTEDVREGEISYEIAHPLIQEAIYQKIGTARRRHMHRVIARALVIAGRLGESAPHFARSAAVGDDEAIHALCDAVRQCETREAFRESLSLLGALVALIPPDDPRWLDVLKALSWRAEWVVDHRADTHALLGIEAMRMIDSVLTRLPDPMARAIVKFRLANFLGWGSGELDEAERACVDAMALYDQTADRSSALLVRNELAWIRGLRGDYPAMETAAAELAANAERAGEPFAWIQALQAQGIAAGFCGRFAEAEAAWRCSNTIAGKHGKAYRLAIGRLGLGVDAAAQGHIEKAIGLIEEGKAGYPRWRDSILPEWQMVVHWFAGDFRAALACAKEFETGWADELSRRRTFGVVFAALAAVEAAETERASVYLARARRAFGDRDWQFFSHLCGHAKGLLDWHGGRLGDAADGLRNTAGRVLATGAQPYAALVLVDLAQLAAERADPDSATEAAGQLDAIARNIPVALYRALDAIGKAWAALAADRDSTAERFARTAVALLTETGCRAFQARGLELLGRSLATTSRDEAVEALGRAVAMFEDCGAVWRRDRARVHLRNLGQRGRRASVETMGVQALSRRERHVARLAVRGCMTGEIAEQLSISKRTVETHLSHIYAKLGIRSKLDLIRRASEFSLN